MKTELCARLPVHVGCLSHDHCLDRAYSVVVALVFGICFPGYPSMPSDLLQGSWFVGTIVDFFLHTNLRADDIAAARIAMHPLVRGRPEEFSRFLFHSDKSGDIFETF